MLPDLEPPRKGHSPNFDWWMNLWRRLKRAKVKGDQRTTIVRETPDGYVVSAITQANQYEDDDDLILAKITTNHGNGTYDAIQQKNTAGAFATHTKDPLTFNSGNNGILREFNGSIFVGVDTIVRVYRVIDANGDPQWYFDGNASIYGVYGAGAWAEVTAESNGNMSWKQKEPDATTDSSPAVTGSLNLKEVEGRVGIKVGSKFWIRYDGTNFRGSYHGAPSGTMEDLRRTQANGASPISDDWERNAQGSAFGFKRNRITGLFANPSTDKLYSVYVEDRFNANGECIYTGPETFEVVACITDITCGGSGTPPVTDLWAHWPYEEGTGTNVADISGNGRDATATGGMGWSGGKRGSYAGDFDGTDDIASRTEVPSDNSGSITAWFKLDSFASGEDSSTIVAGGDTSSGSNYLQLRVQGTSPSDLPAQVIVVAQQSSDTNDIVSASSVSTGVWTHVAVVSNGSAYTIYVNGSAATMTVEEGSNTGDWFADTSSLDTIAMGCLVRSTNSDFFDGDIDDVRIYSKVLTAQEVSDIYNGVL